jgi:hypothetical protein
MMASVKSLVLFAPIPLTLFAAPETPATLRKVNDVKGCLDNEPFNTEQLTLLNLLLSW